MKPQKTIKRIKPKSDSLRARALRELYEEAKAEFLADHRICDRCGNVFKSLELHHSLGRAGTLLIDWRFFNALCSRCHNTVHIAVKEAQKEGWIGGPGQWNTPPRDAFSDVLEDSVINRMNQIGERIKAKVAKKLNKEWEARVRKAEKKICH